MSSGIGRPFLALGLAAAAALGIGGWLYLDASGQERIYEQQAAQKADEYRNSARVRAEARCANLPREQMRSCVYEAYDAAKEGEHNEYDLQAQLVTSAWTKAMGIAAVIAMGVGIFGVGLIYKTFQETRRNADAAEGALRETQRVAAAELRPWIAIEAKITSMTVTSNWIDVGYAVTIRNIGKTIATFVRIEMQHDFMGEDYPDQIDVQFARWATRRAQMKNSAVIPGEEITFAAAKGVSRDIIPWEGTERRFTYSIVMASVFYRSEFEATHHRTDRSFVFGIRGEDPLDHILLYEDSLAFNSDELITTLCRVGDTT
jgi:hypothetical protein